MTAIRNGDPNIQRLPTEAEMRELVEEIIPPDSEDTQFKALIKVLITVGDPDNNDTWHLAMIAARYAYMFTEDFERAFRSFSGMAPIETTIVDYEDLREAARAS